MIPLQKVHISTQLDTIDHLHSTSHSSNDIQERDRATTFVAREYGDRLAHLFFKSIEKQLEWSIQPPDLQEALLPLITIAEHLDVPALLIGSVAGSIYGFPRSAQDVDILADFHREHLPFLFEQLAHNYVFDPHPLTLSYQIAFRVIK